LAVSTARFAWTSPDRGRVMVRLVFSRSQELGPDRIAALADLAQHLETEDLLLKGMAAFGAGLGCDIVSFTPGPDHAHALGDVITVGFLPTSPSETG
jgi:hypothetical protein